MGAIALEGSAHYDGRAQGLQTDLRLTTEAGRVDAQGAVDLAKLRAPPSGFAVRVRQLDLAKLMRDTPVTAIDLDRQHARRTPGRRSPRQRTGRHGERTRRAG